MEGLEVMEVDAPPPLPDDSIKILLKKLVKTVMKFFYQQEESVVVDWVLRNKCITEKEVEDKLKFDVKLARVTLAKLKNDRILNVRTEVGENSDGKRVRTNYYYINYGDLVNVVKYKLENVRISLGSLEGELSFKHSFVCARCNLKWTDSEAGDLFNKETLKFLCRFCHKPVTEDTTEIPEDKYRLVGKFNEQLGPLYDLLQEIDMKSSATQS